MSITVRCVVLLLILGTGVSGELRAQSSDGEKSIDFDNDILPILSNKCFVCHGPDALDDDDLRLDSFAAATSDRGGYKAIDPDSPDQSELIARILSTDDPMPPEDSDKPLTDDERELLRTWVLQGGTYADHWAFMPPRKRVPDGAAELPKERVIDAWVGQGLEAAGTDFAAQADRRTLARRVAIVLTGLPPEPAQLARFLADERPDAYERLVDELMESPRFGEHQARYWLDAVRYGDTHGLHLDNRRGIYPYRDWVVRAFNQNLPLDEFITWQLAGDLLPDPSLEQLVATGFVRMNPTTAEGGAIPAEFQAKNNFDRTEMLGTVLLGMTMTCARCHSHKYDPISQTEYYQLFAFFNSTAEPSMDGNSYTYGPTIKAPQDQAGWDVWSGLESEQRTLDAQLSERIADSASLRQYAESAADFKTENWQVSTPGDVSDTELPTEGWSAIEDLPGESKTKLPLDGEGLWITFTLKSSVSQSLKLTHSGGPTSVLFVDDRSFPISDDLQLSAGEHKIRLRLAGAKGQPALKVNLSSFWRDLVQAGSWEALSPVQRLTLGTDLQGPLYDAELASQIGEWLQRKAASAATYTTSLVARDLPQPRPTRLLRRGEYNLPVGDPLEPGVLSVMGSLPDEASPNRLGLAQWLTSREHPLVTRVLVNQLWQRVFGVGLVRTPEDFGLQGQRPTHPELLDWLAVEMHDSQWNMKQMLRLMVTSRTFRQASARRATIDDPENRLYARGPRYRLDAEVLRDLGLWSSELLDAHMGGEGVKPYQPAGMWLAMAHPGSNTKQYVPDKGQRLYRRSLYVYWKRTSPHPMMTLFDAPDRESSCVQRSRTNTALQSLGLLNEVQRVEMSRKLAERLLRQAETDDERLDLLFGLVACREATDAERNACGSLLELMRQRFGDAPEDAERLLSMGESPRDESLDAATVAAWTQVTSTVLASDVAILLY